MRLQESDVRGPLELFQRTYHSLLRSTGEIQVQALVEPYIAFDPLLHHGARSSEPDLAALTYTSLRLPACIDLVHKVVLGPSPEVFARYHRGNIAGWDAVSAPGRRRKMFFDGHSTLAVLIASPSDLDDLIPMLVGFQIEWNKLHALLSDCPTANDLLFAGDDAAPEQADALLACTGLPDDQQARLQTIWGEGTTRRLLTIARHNKRFAVRMLGGSMMDYERATLRWWWQIEEAAADLRLQDRPVYFVSSNTHSLVNLFSGFALRHSDELLEFIRQRSHVGLLAEYEKIVDEQVPTSRENFFYYVQKKYQTDPASADYFQRRAEEEHELGIRRIPSLSYLDIDAQIIELSKVNTAMMDARICGDECFHLNDSEAVIINIDYPLGLAAYHILKILARSVGELRGVYVLGKAATLNGKIGDVLIPNVVYDEHTRNTFHYTSAFSAIDVEPYLAHGSVLDNQKAVTSPGTFLQNEPFLAALYREFFTDIEMESGPYLNAVYEHTFTARYPTNETVSFLRPPFDMGFLHYASDTPYSKGINLGSRNLSYFGMDPTYATSLAIARRIVQQEMRMLQQQRTGIG